MNREKKLTKGSWYELSQDKRYSCIIPKSKTLYRKFRKAYLKRFDLTNIHCYLCFNGPLVFDKRLYEKTPNQLKGTIDHIVPPGKGGSYYDHDNFAMCCWVCNNGKGEKLVDELQSA